MTEQPGAGAPERRGVSARAIVAVIAAVILLIFAFQNTKSIDVRFLGLRFSWPLWLYTIGAAVFGALVWSGLGVIRRHRRRVQRRADRRS